MSWMQRVIIIDGVEFLFFFTFQWNEWETEAREKRKKRRWKVNLVYTSENPKCPSVRFDGGRCRIGFATAEEEGEVSEWWMGRREAGPSERFWFLCAFYILKRKYLVSLLFVAPLETVFVSGSGVFAFPFRAPKWFYKSGKKKIWPKKKSGKNFLNSFIFYSYKFF